MTNENKTAVVSNKNNPYLREISHAINNLIYPINLNMEMLERELQNDNIDNIYKRLERIKEATEEMSRLTEKLSCYAKTGEEKPV